jgi:putative colanic acid biosysnthesis UDP-glucose lipid carrier transferase
MSRPQIRQHDSWTKLVIKFFDVASIGLGLATLILWIPELDSQATIVTFLIAVGLFSIVAEFFGLYRSWQGIAFEREVTCTLMSWGSTLVVLAAIGQISQYTTELSPSGLLLWFAITPPISLTARIALRYTLKWFVRRHINTRNYAVIGCTDIGVQLVDNVEQSPELALSFLGFYDDRPEERTVALPSDKNNRLGKIDDLVHHAKNKQVDVVFITLPMRAEKRIREVIHELTDTTVSVYFVPDLFVFQMLHSRWTDVQGLPVVSVFENPFYGVDGVFKRICDFGLACVALIAAAIPMSIIAAAVKLTSRGPVLFKQKRYGLDGREIDVWKFRSMTTCDNGSEIIQATKNDTRLTRIGGFLRKTSLDELPQLFNVLMGSMSLVGPRPHANAHNELYRGQIQGYMLRHKVKPGITGLAQVNGYRGETDTLDKMEGRIKFDHQYIREWSIWLDLKILFQTFWVVLKKDNAY